MKCSATLSVSLMLCSIFALGQTDGVLPFSTIENHGIDSINLQNLNVLLNVPIRGKSGAMPFGFQLQGNSNCEKYTDNSNNHYLVCGIRLQPKSIDFYNWNLTEIASGLGIQAAAQTVTSGSCTNINGGNSIAERYTNWAVKEPNGTVHPLSSTDEIDVPTTQYSQPACVKSSFTDTTRDNSGFTAVVACAGGPGCPWNAQTNIVVYDSSGKSVSSTSLPAYAETDSNGNTMYSTYSTGATTYVDTLGGGNGSSGIPTPLTLTYGSYTQDYPNSYSWTDVNDAPQAISEVTSFFNIQTAFSCSGVTDSTFSNAYLLTGINFPTGGNVAISYEQTPSKPGYYTGRVNTITNRTGGSITYAYSGGNNGLDCTFFLPPSLTRTTTDGVTSYTWALVNNGNGNFGNTTTVVDQGGNKTVYTFTGVGASYPVAQILTQVQKYQGSSTLLSTTLICYNNNFTNCSTANVSYPISKRDVYTYPTGMTIGQARLTEQTYDSYGNVLTDSEFNYNQSLVSSTTMTYGSWNGSACVSISSVINNKPCDVTTVEYGATVGESRFTYDSHGNLLRTYRWSGSSWLSNITANTYNSNGTLATSYDLANNQTSYAYNGTGGCSGLFPTSVTAGGLTTYKTWDCDGGVPLTSTDANGKVTTYGYVNSTGVADPFWRVSSVTDPLGNKTWTSYTATSRKDSFTFNSGSSINNTTRTTDGYGRQINVQKQQSPSASQYDTSSTTYGWSSNYRSVSTAMPCFTTLWASCSGSGVTTLTDPLGRPYTVTDGGSGTITNTYAQNDVLSVLSPAPAGENVKQTQKQYDGLGRLQYSCAIGNGSSTACNQNTGSANGVTTSYTYSAATGSTTTTATRGSQSRVKTSDALGRVTAVTTPEGGRTQYFYDSAPATPGVACPGTYNGDLLKVYSANGNTTCNTYDGLHRVLSTITSGPNSNSVNKYFVYDSATVSGATMQNTAGRLAEAYTTGVMPFQNTDFEASSSLPPPGWSAGLAVLSYDTVTQYAGVRSLKTAATGLYGGAYSPYYSGIPGKTYTISGYIKSDGTCIAYIQIRFLDSAGTYLDSAQTAGSTQTSWNFATATNVAPAGTVYTQLGLPNANSTGAGVCEFDNVTANGLILTDEGFSYDADGRLTDVYESTPHSGGYYHTTAQLFANGALQSLSGIPGYTALSYGIDGEGRLSTAQKGTFKIVCDSGCSSASTTYDAGGHPLIVKVGGTTDNDTYTYYPNTGRMQTYNFNVGSASVAGALTWNANGTLRTLAITDGFNSGGTQTCNYGTSSTMGYDDLGRLLSVNCGSPWAQTFSYDQYDNITKSGSISWACPSCYDATTNHYNSTLSSSISYDNKGNLLNDTFNKYTWDAYGHPSTIGPTTGSVTCGTTGTCLTYDAQGRMVEKSVNNVYSEILYSPVGKTAIMSGMTTSSAYFPLPAGATYYASGSTGGNSYFWHKDWLGSVRFASTIGNRSSYYDRAFAPYGEMYNNFGNTGGLDFTGDTQDTISGTFDTPARELNPSQGRWISPDSAGAGWNLYAYSTNPDSSIDPTGTRDLEGSAGMWDPLWGGGQFGAGVLGAFFGGGALYIAPTVPANQGLQQVMDAFNSVVGAAFQPALQMVNWGLINWDDYQQFGGRVSTTVNVGWFKNTVFNPYGHIAIGIGDSPLVGLNPASDLGFVAQLAMWGIACGEFCDPFAMTVVPGSILPEDPNTAATQLRSLYVSADQGIVMQTFIGLSRDNPPDYSVQGPPPACDCGSWAQQVLRFGGIDPGPPAWKPETVMQQLPALPMMYMQTGPWWEGFPHN